MGLRPCSQDAPPIYREDTFPASRAFRLSPAREEVTELSAPRDRGEDRSPAYRRGFLRFAPKLFSVDRIRCEDYRIISENRDGCLAKSFFDGKFGVSLFRSNE
jgi:hypothetical protein